MAKRMLKEKSARGKKNPDLQAVVGTLKNLSEAELQSLRSVVEDALRSRLDGEDPSDKVASPATR
jgi:hypothetical protein